MMKKNIIISVLVFVVMFSCGEKYLMAEKTKITQEVSVDPFSKLEMRGVFNIEISQGSSQKVVFEGSESIFNEIHFQNEGDKTLKIEYKKKKIKFKTSHRAILKITVVDIEKIKTSNVGKIKIIDLKAKDLTLDISSVGENSLSLDCVNLKAKFSGTGNTKISGDASEVEIIHRGVGNLNAMDFETRKMNVESSGVGNVRVNATMELKVINRGVGNIYYKGEAPNLHVEQKGIGKIIKQ